MSYKQGDVVFVKFMFSEGKGFKRRPACIISGRDYNNGRNEVIIAGITSNVGRTLVGDTVLSEWKQANLLFPSSVVAIIQTVKPHLIERRLGKIEDSDFKSVKRNLKHALNL